MRRRPPPFAQGLTLIELMIAVAVLAILVSLAAPSFGGQIDRQRLRGAAEGLALDLAEARFEAARRGQSLHVSFAPGTDWCYAVATVGGCDCHSVQPCQIKTVRAADLPGTTLAQAQDAQFDANGASPAGTAVLWQSRQGDRLRVAHGALGRARICSPDGRFAGYPPC